MSWLALYKTIFSPYIPGNSELHKVDHRPAILEIPVVDFTSELVLKYKPDEIQIVDIDCTHDHIVLDIRTHNLPRKEADKIKKAVRDCRLNILDRIYELKEDITNV